MADPNFRCAHCGHDKCQAARGLCETCYETPTIRPLYPDGRSLRWAGGVKTKTYKQKSGPCNGCRTPIKWLRAGGLCWKCYADPATRERFPADTGKHARRGLGNDGTPPLAPEPTLAPPGSKEKVAVMAWRAENGFQPFHPDDAEGPGVSWAGFTHLLPGDSQATASPGKPRHLRRVGGRSAAARRTLYTASGRRDLYRATGIDD